MISRRAEGLGREILKSVCPSVRHIKLSHFNSETHCCIFSKLQVCAPCHGCVLYSFLAPPAERQRSFSNTDSSVVRRRPSSVVGVNFSLKILISQKLPDNFFSFLAPPAERQRSFSNADSSVVRRRRRRLSSSVVVNFSLKMLISQKLPDNFFSFLVYSFIRKVPMYCINIYLIESS